MSTENSTNPSNNDDADVTQEEASAKSEVSDEIEIETIDDGSEEIEEEADLEVEEERDPVELMDLDGAKHHIYSLRTKLETAITERDTAREKVNELGSRLKGLSEAYQKKGDEVKKAKDRLERQSKFNEDRRRGEAVSSLFEPFENLKRSIDAIEKAGVESSHIDGLRIVSSSFMNAFNTLGLEEVPGVGASFDPNVHEALMIHEVNDPAMKDVVIEVFASGYRIGDTVLRPAKVIVGSYTAPPEPEVVEAEEVSQEQPEEDAE
ncbi:MAG: nucleotide exchange factor GrpE [Myxococcota bacterium]